MNIKQLSHEKNSDNLFAINPSTQGQLKPYRREPPAGQDKEIRNQLAEAFIAALQADFHEHGKTAIEAVRKTKPDQYLRVVTGLLPKELTVNVNEFDGLSDDQLIERLKELSASIQPYINGAGDGENNGGTET